MTKEYFKAKRGSVNSGKRISKRQYNKNVDEITAEIAQGKTVSHESVVKEIGKWLGRK